MIEKLILIHNYGKFKHFDIAMSDWDGTFKKTNVIYAPNGSGKTTLALLFNSLSGNNELLLKKKSFGSQIAPEIKFMSGKKELKYTNNKWNRFVPCIEVFNSFYIDENTYTITIEDDMSKPNLFELSIGEDISAIKNSIINATNEKNKISKKIGGIKTSLKKAKNPKEKNTKEKILQQLNEERKEKEKFIKEQDKKRIELAEINHNKYVTCINKYLTMFCDNISISNVKIIPNASNHKQKIIYSININDHEISLEERVDLSLKYCLSDGDKNALSLSFFLARFDMIPNIKDYTVVIDDPFTSFDFQRKATTITQLSRLASKVEQFFLFTHDLHFANDFNNSYNDQVLNLKISHYNNSSILCEHDIKFEMLNGFNKDLMTLRRFHSDPKDNSLYLREVIRCIRPSIEGIFRLKYYNYVKDNEWLGDFIAKIRDSNESSPYYRLKEYIDEIEEINDYCKQYHHSNPNYLEVNISSIELKNYVRRTIKLIENI